MGFRVCYLATRAPAEECVKALNLAVAETTTEIPEGDWWVVTLKKNGWSIFWSENEQFAGDNVNRISELSERFQTYVCHVNETVMWSSAELWREGKMVWRVAHQGDGDDRFDLSTNGPLPKEFEALKDQHFNAQRLDGEGVDHVFEIPLDLAACEIGFRHDECLDPAEADVIYRIVPPPKKNLLSRLFGR